MYSLVWLGLLAGLLVAPGLAVAPRLMFSARTAIALPLVSVLLLYGLKEFLYLLSSYNTATFRAAVVVLVSVAAVRVGRRYRSESWQWSHQEISCYLFNFLLFMPLLLWFWVTPYDPAADAINSWELWAQQHYLGQRPDFFFTQSPYPQAYPVFISNLYCLWGSADYHQLARSLFAIFPFCVLTGISLAFVDKGRSAYGAFGFSVILYLLFFREAFFLSCADPMMTSAILLSAFYTLGWCQNGKVLDLQLSAVCALLAVLTKQQAVIWTFLAWPIMLMVHSRRFDALGTALYLVVAVGAGFMIWFVSEGGGLDLFNNKLALHQAAEHNATLWGRARQGFVLVFIFYPALLLLLAAQGYLMRYSSTARILGVFFVLPALILWIFFGNYSVHRAGIQAVAIMALVIASEWDRVSGALSKYIPGPLSTVSGKLQKLPPVRVLALVAAILFVLLFEGFNYFRKYPLGDGHRNTLLSFGPEYAELVTKIYDHPGLRIINHTAYINNIMLRRAHIARPEHGSSELDVLNLIEKSNSQYVFPYPYYVDRTPLGRTIDNLATFCPELVSPYIDIPGMEVYHLHQEVVAKCREILMREKFYISTD